jgi:hypothetical protein
MARRFTANRFAPHTEKIFPLESVAALDTLRGSDVLGFKSSMLTISFSRALGNETWTHSNSRRAAQEKRYGESRNFKKHFL